MRTKAEWEQWYATANPWGTEGGDEDEVRTALLIDRLRHARFANLLDLGCGEGKLTNALSQLAENALGVDISSKALERAALRFPHIRFRQGDILDLIQDPDIAATPFDLISVSEVLYYLQTDHERRTALAGLATLGAPTCLYYFSVLVVGASKYRRYFTHDEFVRIASEHFQIVDSFASVAALSPTLRFVRSVGTRRWRVALLKALTVRRQPEQCRHVGYFALKRITAEPGPVGPIWRSDSR